MTLPMPRPWRHPKTGVFWLRKRVPDDLRSLVGKLEEKQSLKTKDAGEAKIRLAQALLALDAKWANFRRGPTILTEAEAHKLASATYDEWINQHADNPTEQPWNTEIWAAGPWGKTLQRVAFIGHEIEQMRWFCVRTADKLLTDGGIVTDATGRERLAFAVGSAVQ